MIRLLVWAGFAFACTVTCAAGFPDGNVKIVVPFTAGSLNDLVARALGQKLDAVWGKRSGAQIRYPRA